MSCRSEGAVESRSVFPPRIASTPFLRRLFIVAAAMALLMVPLVGQLARLTIARGHEFRLEAESALLRREVLPTYRGAIIDRQGRILAVDRPVYALHLPYPVISGEWVTRASRRAASDAVGARRFRALSEADRARLAERWRPAAERQREWLFDRIAESGGLERAEVDARVAAIRERVEVMAEQVWRRQEERERARRGNDPGYTFVREPILEQVIAHEVLAPLSDDAAYMFRAMSIEMAGMFEIRDTTIREYPWSTAEVMLDRRTLPGPLASNRPLFLLVDGVADHLLGSMRPVWAQDVRERPFRSPVTGEVLDPAGYAPTGDVVGSFGLERSFEPLLRGSRGEERRRVDDGSIVRVPPVPGRDLHLTIDIELQARIQAILDPALGLCAVQPWHENAALPPGTPLCAAAVVIEVSTGEIVAMVSSPTRSSGHAMSAPERISRQPWINRPAEAIYPPGSIVKPLVFAGAVTDGKHAVHEAIVCTGHYFPGVTDAARCWIYREQFGLQTHGPLLGAEALARSCNIYFYTLADRMGMESITRWMRVFGVGDIPGSGLTVPDPAPDAPVTPDRTGESAGTLPDLSRGSAARFETVLMGIGQGPVTWTPLQAANAYAQFARGGAVRDATLLRDPDLARAIRRQRDDAPLHSGAVREAMKGLRDAVEAEYGTGHHIRYTESARRERIMQATGVRVWAKTGTAQAPPWDLDGDGIIDDIERERRLSHAWFVGLVGPSGSDVPHYAIAVIVEYGGSGGRVAGPVADQIIRALQRERYLPGDPEGRRE